MIPERAALKRRLMEDRQRWGSASQVCEGRAYLPHTCSNAWHLNEVIFSRNKFKHLTEAGKRYFWHEINCSVVCSRFHTEHGHSHAFRRWFLDRVSRIYGGTTVANYIGNAPLKMKPIL